MLIGRDEEQARLQAVVRGAREGRGAAVLLSGEPGIGKTALLDALAAGAADCLVLRARGVEAEAQLAYAGFSELLAPVLGTLDALDGPQPEALRAGLRLGPPAKADLYLAYGGVLQLLATLARQQPVLCLVDNLHWVDAVSSEGLLFLARRLGQERIAMVLATRADKEDHGLETIRLRGLGEVDAHLLLTATGARLEPATASAVIAGTASNPLALLEAPGLLTAEQRAGVAPLDTPLLVGPAVERAFLARVRRLSPGARRTLLLAAVSIARDLDAIVAAAGDNGAGLDEAEGAGLLVVAHDQIGFRHPLVRASVHAAATSGELRAAHAALAEALTDDAEDRHLWHRAAAALGPDPALAAELDGAADRARLRCCVDEHMLRERAAGLSQDVCDRARRLHRSAVAAHAGGRSRRAMALIDEGLEAADDPITRADLLEARLAIADDLGTVHAHLQPALRHAAAVEPLDPARAEALRARAVLDALERFDLLAARALAPAALPGATAAGLAATARLGLLDVGEHAAALAAAREGAMLSLDAGTAGLVAAIFAEALMVSGEEEPARALLAGIVDQATARGFTVALVRGLSVASELHLRRGQVAQALVLAEQAVEAAAEDELAHCLVKALAARAGVLAVLGDPACVPAAEAVLSGAARALDRWSEVRAYDALGRLALSRGDATSAVAAFEQVERTVPPGAHAGPLRWRPDLVEAYVRLERAAEAAAVQERFERQAARAPTAWTGAAAARGRALLAGRDEADERFAEAARLAAPVSQLDVARAELERGAGLRRAGRRGRAQSHLETAAATFARLGAASWAAQAADELRACGVAPRERRAPVLRQLTPRELEVAMLAAAGATNREIGARLYMSAKTVEVHLGRVYRKLGLRSRTELARLDALVEADPLRDAPTI